MDFPQNSHKKGVGAASESKTTEEEDSLENEYKGNNNKIVFMTFMATDTTV